MAVYVSALLERRFATLDGLDLQGFANAFQAWLNQPATRLANPYFGKNRTYHYPLDDGEDGLWHVHLQPRPTDLEATLEWKARLAAGIEKTSDAALIYTLSVDGHDALLLAALTYGAHPTIPDNAAGDEVLRRLARIANDWRLRPAREDPRWRLIVP